MQILTQTSIGDFIENLESECDINEAQFSQPVCTVLQIALVDLLRSFGVTPLVVLGHSSGEIAAACAANGISRESAWKLAYYRGVPSSDLGQMGKVPGAMISAVVRPDAAQLYIDQIVQKSKTDVLCVACINSPSNVTVSGSSAGV